MSIVRACEVTYILHMLYLVYKITNLLNDRYYIGKHKTNNINDRYMGSGPIITHAIKKYGRDNFIREYLFFAFDENSMNWAEEQLVMIQDKDPLSYNIQKGGKGGNPPRNDVRGNKNGMFGRTGNLNPAFGKIWITDGIIEKMVAKDYIIPDGWYRGKSNSSKEICSKASSGSNNPMYGSVFIWISDGTTQKRANKEDVIPDGWYRGMRKRVQK